MRFRLRLLLLPCLMAGAMASLPVRSDQGDVENAHDYPGFPRVPGFVITDYDEDNPAEFVFPVSRPTSLDSDHMEMVHVKGHRYVIRYEAPADHAPSLLQTQQYYEKLATDAGMKIEKSGAVGDVTETFHLTKSGHDLWVNLDPSITINILTIVESSSATPSPSPPTVVKSNPAAPAQAPGEAKPTVPPPVVNEDAFYKALVKDGRVVLPLTFFPGKPDLDADSQPVIDRVAAMMKQHPELQLEIEGHTDNTGDPRYNEMLSKQRATTVRGMLVAEHVGKARLVATGLGGDQPLGDNNTSEGREKNRRIELVLRKNSGPDDAAKTDTDENETTSFHAPAPDGVNYYPKSGSSAPEQ